MNEPLAIDLKSIREKARDHLENGPVTEGYQADREEVIRVLNTALATEIVCALRYRNHYFKAQGIHAESVVGEFLQHSNEEQAHADRLAARIVQLGGSPEMNPDLLLKNSHAEYKDPDDLQEMIREDLIAERIAIDTYGAIVRWLGDKDPTTRRLLEDILAQEEEHADDMANLLARSDGGPSSNNH